MNLIQKVGSVSSESVKKHTKKDWESWIKILNSRSAQLMSHQELVQLLKKEFKLTTWWQQEVARGYQTAIGLRIPHQTLKGTYTTTATKSLSISAKKIYLYLISEEGQNLWLKPMYPVQFKEKQSFECEGEIFGEIRTLIKNKKIRISWIDPDWPRKSIVHIELYSKPKSKTMIVINHTDLPSLKVKTQMHAHWRGAVDQIAEILS